MSKPAQSRTRHGHRKCRTKGSPDVFVGSRPVARVGDDIGDESEERIVLTGENTVTINARPVARVNGTTTTGSITLGSYTFLVGTG